MSRDVPPGEINPYASPTISDPPLPLNAGIGVWSDGYLIVMHREGVLPAFCVKTGVACHTSVRVEIVPMQFSAAPVRTPVPLAAWWRIAAVHCREQMLLLGFALVFGAIMLDAGLQWLLPGSFIFPCVLVGGGLFILLAAFGLWFGAPLDCVRSDGPYLWLRGASPRFLATLPEWTP